MVQMMNQQSEVQHYPDILSHCRSQLIPLTAVPTDLLKKDLERLDTELRKHGQLAIPASEVTNYYSYKITSCHLNEDTIHINLRVPVRPWNEEFILYLVVNVPFAFENNICTLTHTPTYLAVSKQRILSIQGMEIKFCEPETGLCFASQYNADPAMGSACAEKITSTASVSDLKEVCSFECKLKPTKTNYVTQLDLHFFVITNPPNGTALYCRQENEDVTKGLVSIVQTGALE